MISTLSELAGFGLGTYAAYRVDHTAGYGVAAFFLVLIGYASEGVSVNLRPQVARLKAARERRKAAKAARKAD